MIKDRRVPRGNEARIGSRLGKANIILYISIICTLFVQLTNADIGSSMRRGNYLYRKGKYEEALKKYQEALVQEPDNPKIHYNIARALYKMEQYDEAISEFQLGLLEKDKNFHANTFYNIGNCQFKKGQLNAAIESYKTTLLLNPEDTDAKQNLEFCLKVKEHLENQPQGDSLSQQQQPQPQPQPQPRKSEVSREEAARILQALKNKEKENLEKSKKKERKERVEKDW
ncbi:hypothetical protein AMJ74_00100 [candidate division WOR_3 bacterium SM1_77]|uniref:Uncharacterized protein n=1 Tax=candidate division WOR_3 bacterium SM1_77 TaxID=1703778 RepID=A0A0S8K1Y7_UNCW3|nr:MAG: hypothetical protein AMJ74_00100 [candidate division WOR_3 bacterium SM1_77]